MMVHPPLVCVRKRLGLVAGAADGQREVHRRRPIPGPFPFTTLAPRPARPAFVGSNSQALQLTKGRPAIN